MDINIIFCFRKSIVDEGFPLIRAFLVSGIPKIPESIWMSHAIRFLESRVHVNSILSKNDKLSE